MSRNENIIDALTKQTTEKLRYQDDIYDALEEVDFEKLKLVFVSMFASIPHDNYRKNKIAKYEGFYASVIYIYLQSLGLEIIGEDVTNKGNIDLTVKLDNLI